MRNRIFGLANSQLALRYVTLLLERGIRFEVIPHTGRVDVVTPFDLKEDEFPRASWLCWPKGERAKGRPAVPDVGGQS